MANGVELVAKARDNREGPAVLAMVVLRIEKTFSSAEKLC